MSDAPCFENIINRDSPISANLLKKLALDSGADDAGIISINSPDIADQKKEILDLFPGTKTVVSLVQKLNRENIRCVSRAVSDLEYLQTFDQVNRTARKIASALSERGIGAIHHSSGFPMDTSKWPGQMWPIAHKTIAVAAGMGKIGLNRLVLHPKFGSFVILDTLLCDCSADAFDAPLDEDPCINCRLCVSACPVGAIRPDGYFYFSNCMTHNYRDRMGGFSDWVENVVTSKTRKEYRSKVSDPETVSMWQSLSYGICNKSSYCMAVCPAGTDIEPLYRADKKAFVNRVARPLREKTETVFVVPGTDAKNHVEKRFPHKTVKPVHNGLRPDSASGFLNSLTLVFQRDKAKEMDTVYHFSFYGDENIEATVAIKKGSLTIKNGHDGQPDIHITADAGTWIQFLAGEKNLLLALLQRKIRVKGSPSLMKRFALCFPS